MYLPQKRPPLPTKESMVADTARAKKTLRFELACQVTMSILESGAWEDAMELLVPNAYKIAEQLIAGK